MLKDKVTIKVQSGAGGRGSRAVFASRSIGGNGGRGGSVYVVGSSNMYDLSSYDHNKTYKADNGENGQKQNKHGKDARELLIMVPLETDVHKDGELLTTIKKDGQRFILLEGGVGGYGNSFLRRNHKVSFQDNLEDAKFKKVEITLTLKLQSDLIFIGYPSAGKSSLLNVLAKTKMKTAEYEFTTLDPQIGLMDGLRLMDLPGLIEGTHEGKGLGTKFLKHTENSRLVAHCVSLEHEHPLEVHEGMRDELKKIDRGLYDKKEFIVLTKSDLVEAEDIEKFKKSFEEKGLDVLACSIIDDEAIEKVAEYLEQALQS